MAGVGGGAWEVDGDGWVAGGVEDGPERSKIFRSVPKSGNQDNCWFGHGGR